MKRAIRESVAVSAVLLAALFALRKLFAEGPEPPQIENT